MKKILPFVIGAAALIGAGFLGYKIFKLKQGKNNI